MEIDKKKGIFVDHRHFVSDNPMVNDSAKSMGIEGITHAMFLPELLYAKLCPKVLTSLRKQQLTEIIMHQQNITKVLLFMLFASIAGGCAVRYEERLWRLENPEYKLLPSDTTDRKFELGNVSLTVQSLMVWSKPLAYGPPFMPVIPSDTPERPARFGIAITVDSPLDATVIDFSRVHVKIPGGKILHLQNLDVWKSEKPPSKEWKREELKVPIGKDTVSNEKKRYSMTFADFPWDAEEFLLDLGNIEIGGKEQKTPALRYRVKKTRGYNPVNFH